MKHDEKVTKYFVSCIDDKDRTKRIRFSTISTHADKAIESVESYIKDFKLWENSSNYTLRVRKLRVRDIVDYAVPLALEEV